MQQPQALSGHRWSTDFDVHGLVTIRLQDAPPHIRDTVTQELGSARTMPRDAPDLIVTFTDQLHPRGYLRLLGLNQAGFDDEHFYLFDRQGRGRGSTWPAWTTIAARWSARFRSQRFPLLSRILGLRLSAKTK